MSLTGCVYKTLYWFAGALAICALMHKLIESDAHPEPSAALYEQQWIFLAAGILIGAWSVLVLTGHAMPKLSWLWRRQSVSDRGANSVWPDSSSEVIYEPLPLRWASEASVDHALSDAGISQKRIPHHPATQESGSISQWARQRPDGG